MDRIQIFCYGFCERVTRKDVQNQDHYYEGTEPGADGYLYDIYYSYKDDCYKAINLGVKDDDL